MLQTNLIYGIQKKIKEGRAIRESGVGVLEESAVADTTVAKEEILLENYYNPGIIAGVSKQVKDSKKVTVQKRSLMTEAFHMAKAEKKLNKDINYFNYLYENFVPEVFKKDYEMLLESIFEDTIRLYQECDVTPRVVSPALDSNELTESQIVDLYKNSLNHSIKENYTKPLLSGKISELFEGEIRIVTKKLIEENVNTDTDQVRIYLPFEETLYRFNREILIPKTADSRINMFMESTTAEYTDLLEESAQDLLKAVEKKIKLLTSMVSPGMFDKAVDADGVDAPKMAGVSITVDKNFNEEPEEEIIPSGDEGEAEAAEELMDDEEAEETDAADAASQDSAKEGSDVGNLEDGARNEAGLVTNVDDLESGTQEDKSELSPSEDSNDDDQPGAIEGDLPSASSDQGASGYASNNSDVELQGDGNDNGAGSSSGGATLPGGATNGTSSDVSQDISISNSSDSLPAGGAVMPSSASAETPNDSDVGIGSSTAVSTSVSPEIIGADGDNDPGEGEVVDDGSNEEVNTETPSEEQMNEVKDEVNDSTMPRL